MRKIRNITMALLLILSLIAVSNRVVEAKVVKKSGIYGTLLTTKKSPYDDQTYIKKVILKKDKIITYGCFYFGKQIPCGKYLKVKKRSFKLSKKCKFLKNYTYPGKEHRTTKKYTYRFIRNHTSKRGGFIYLKVKKGKVIKIMTGEF